MTISRRQVLGGAVAAIGSAVVADVQARPSSQGAADRRPAREPFGYCMNTSTIRGHDLDIVAEIDLLSKAGYTGVEPWIQEIDAYTAAGGTLRDLGQRFADAGLTVENAIAFNSFVVADEAARAQGMERLAADMDKVARIGGTRIAAPPGRGQGAVSLDDVATWYRAALDLGRSTGVLPVLELWGTHPVLGPLSHGAYAAVATGDRDASLLLDVFHLYKSGSPFDGLRQLNGATLHVLHINDYPAADAPSTLNDGNRIYPGDGVAPLDTILRDLRDIGFRGALSLELFNRDYWAKSAEDNAKMGIDKIRTAVTQALA